VKAPSEVCWTKDWNSYCSGIDACSCREFHQTARCAPLYDHYTSTAAQKGILRINDDTTRSVGAFTVIGRIAGTPKHDTSRDIKIYSSSETWVALSADKMDYLRDRLSFRKKTTTKTSTLLQGATTLSNPFPCGYAKWFLFPLTAGTSSSSLALWLTIQC